MNELVIFSYSLKRAFSSSFKCYELAVREIAKDHVLIRSQGANGMVSNGLCSSRFSFFYFENLSVSLHYSAI